MHLRQFSKARMKRIPQPPINPALRDPERHDFWTGFVLVLVSLFVLVCGATHITNVDTVEGSTAREAQLVKAFTSGGLEFTTPEAMPKPAEPGDPAAEAKALEQMERVTARQAKGKYRVNTGAQVPCPT